MDISNNFLKGVVRIGGLAVLLASLMLGVSGAGASEPAIPAGASLHTWFDNGTNGHYVLNVIEGHVPFMLKAGTVATVMTDSNCAPDAEGLNHCHNVIRFANGSEITVVNNHQMSAHRCLRPGETVRINLLAQGWITLQIG